MSDVQVSKPHLRDIHAPAPLRDMPYWLSWAYEQHPGESKPRKVPQYSMGGRRYGQQGSPADRAKLTTFAVARDAAARRGMDGVGFALAPDAGLIALDFDKCVVDGVVDPQVLDLVQGTYAEYSPSGTGIRAFFWGAADVLGNQKSHATSEQFGAEVFSSNGFVTVTGWALDYIDLCGWMDKIAPLPQRVIEFCKGRFGPATHTKVDPDDFMIGHEPRLGLTVDQIEEAISNLDPDMGREDWIKIGMAISHECEGDDTGFEIWNEWSACGSKYPNEEALRQQWDSFGRPRAGRRQVTMATVLCMAKEASQTLITAGPVPKAVEPSLGKAVEPFPGFMADVVELALATAHKRQPELIVLGVLVAMATACGSASHLPDGMRLNLYGIGAATTGSGKDHVLRVASTIVRASGATLLGDFASGPGLEDALKEGGLFANIDEIAHVLAARGEQGTAHLKAIERMLLKLFSDSKDQYTTRTKAGITPRTIANPSLSLMGFAVPAKLGEALTDGDIASGLLNRMLFAAGDGAAPPQPGVRQKFELSNEMLSKLGSIGLAHSAITLSDEVEQRVEALKFELHDAEQRLLEETPERLLLGRTLEKSLRIAGVLAVFDMPGKPMVKLEHLDWAVGFVRESDAALLKFIKQHMHGGKVQADAAKVQDIARSILTNTPPNARPTEIAALTAGYAPISLITKRSHLNAKEVEEAIKLLSMRGDMVRSRFTHEPPVGRSNNCEVLCFPE